MSLGLGNILVQQRSNTGGSGTTPNLQQVTDVGNNTTNDIRLDFVGEQNRGLFVYNTGNFEYKCFFGIDDSAQGQVQYFVTGAVNTQIGFRFANDQTLRTYEGANDKGLRLGFANNDFALGDYSGSNNGCYVDVNDADQIIATGMGGVNGYFGLFLQPGTALLGDPGNYNNTYIQIDDDTQRLNVSSNLISGSAGSNSSQHLSIYVSGTHYKIQLKNP